MRSAWVDAGNDCDWAKATAHKLTAIYYPLSDPVDKVKARLLDTKARGYAGGVYVVKNSEPQWAKFNIDDPHAFAALVSLAVGQVVNTVGPSWPKVQFDLEMKDPVFIAAVFEHWREFRPNQDTSWTLESGQAGWMAPEFVASVVKNKIRVSEQLYNGSMTEVRDSLSYAKQLMSAGFPSSLLSPTYDAAKLPVGWDGWAFTVSRLP